MNKPPVLLHFLQELAQNISNQNHASRIDLCTLLYTTTPPCIENVGKSLVYVYCDFPTFGAARWVSAPHYLLDTSQTLPVSSSFMSCQSDLLKNKSTPQFGPLIFISMRFWLCREHLTFHTHFLNIFEPIGAWNTRSNHFQWLFTYLQPGKNTSSFPVINTYSVELAIHLFAQYLPTTSTTAFSIDERYMDLLLIKSPLPIFRDGSVQSFRVFNISWNQ